MFLQNSKILMLKENYCLFNTNGNEIAQLNKTRNACQRNSLSEHKESQKIKRKIGTFNLLI